MYNSCLKCGSAAPKTADKEHGLLVCPDCGRAERFVYAPLYLIGGSSGSGKSAVCHALLGKTGDIIPFDADTLWSSGNFTPDAPEKFYEACLRLCKNLSQSGKRVAVFHAGMGMPQNIEPCVESRYFSAIRYLGLYCSGDALRERLIKRREAGGFAPDGFIMGMQAMNRETRDREGIDTLDTTDLTVEQTAEKVLEWLQK